MAKEDGAAGRELVTRYTENHFKVHPCFVDRNELADLRSAINQLLQEGDWSPREAD